jgi:hypothetical protein
MDDKTFFNRPISSQGSKVAAVTPHDTDDLELVDLGEDAGIKKAPVLYITTGGLLKFLPIQNDPADWISITVPDTFFFPIQVAKVHTDTTATGIFQII